MVLRDRCPPPVLRPDFPILAPHVDNGNIIGISRESVAATLAALTEELEGVGFVVHEKVAPTRDLELVGLCLDGRRRWLRPKPSRFWRLWLWTG